MNWWRAYHGISNNAKLAVVAAKAGATRSEVGWIWVVLLDYASQAEDRGCVDGLDVERISFMAEIDASRVEAIVDVMKQKGLIDNGRLTSWDRRQPEREDLGATERQRKRRERLAESVTSRNVTQCHAVSQQIRVEEKRVDEKREETPPNPLAPDGAFDRSAMVRSANGHRPNKRRGRTTSDIEKALGDERLKWWKACWAIYPCRDGMNPAMDTFERKVHDHDLAATIYKGIERYAAKCKSDPTIKIKYFQGWLNDERWTDESRPIVEHVDPKVEARRKAWEQI